MDWYALTVTRLAKIKRWGTWILPVLENKIVYAANIDSSLSFDTTAVIINQTLFTLYNMRQVQPETLPKNSNFSSCLQNIKLYQK